MNQIDNYSWIEEKLEKKSKNNVLHQSDSNLITEGADGNHKVHVGNIGKDLWKQPKEYQSQSFQVINDNMKVGELHSIHALIKLQQLLLFNSLVLKFSRLGCAFIKNSYSYNILSSRNGASSSLVPLYDSF